MRTPSKAGPAVRVAIALLLCAACFQGGRWWGQLEAAGAPRVKTDSGNEMVSSSFHGPAEKASEPRPLVAAGDPVDEAGGDIITPLNVRDPSALVMGPGAMSRPDCVSPVAPPRPAKAAKPLKPGRLLELLQKQGEAKPDSPKGF